MVWFFSTWYGNFSTWYGHIFILGMEIFLLGKEIFLLSMEILLLGMELFLLGMDYFYFIWICFYLVWKYFCSEMPKEVWKLTASQHEAYLFPSSLAACLLHPASARGFCIAVWCICWWTGWRACSPGWWWVLSGAQCVPPPLVGSPLISLIKWSRFNLVHKNDCWLQNRPGKWCLEWQAWCGDLE